MKFKSGQVLPKELMHALLNCEYFRERKAACVNLLRLRKRHVSTVYQLRVWLENGERVYWIKVSRGAEQEYRFLQSAYEQFHDIEQFTVVKPVTYLENFPALITEHTDGELLSSRIKRRLNRVSALIAEDERVRRDCYMCGNWLALLHTYELPSNQQYDLEELIKYVDVRLKRLVDRSGLEKDFCERVLAYLLQILSMVPPEDLVRVRGRSSG